MSSPGSFTFMQSPPQERPEETELKQKEDKDDYLPTTQDTNTNSKDDTEELQTSLAELAISETVKVNQTNISQITTETKPEQEESMKPKLSYKEIMSTRVIPQINVSEMILICMDTCADPNYTPFTLADKSTYSPLYMFKRTVEIFVKNKHFIDPKHQYALLICKESSVKWIQDFTSNPSDISLALKDITECEQKEEFDMSLLFETIWQNVTLPKVEKITDEPDHVIRLIFLYSRSFCLPVMKRNFNELLKSPYFTMDVVMTHEDLSSSGRCKEAFNILKDMDGKGLNFAFDVGRDPTLLHGAMAKLLSHPLQRPAPEFVSYSVVLPEKEE